jgi:hypothetical protein
MAFADRLGLRGVVWVLVGAVALAGVGVALARATHIPNPLKIANPTHVFLENGCPSKIGFSRGENAPDHLDAIMVPPEPTKALICRYSPIEGIQSPRVLHGFLYRSVHLGRSDARRLAEDLDRLRPFPKGAWMCDSDSVRYDIMVFGYSGRQDVDVFSYAEGCPSVNNGYLMKGFLPPFDAFVKDFDRLAPRVETLCVGGSDGGNRGECPR